MIRRIIAIRKKKLVGVMLLLGLLKAQASEENELTSQSSSMQISNCYYQKRLEDDLFLIVEKGTLQTIAEWNWAIEEAQEKVLKLKQDCRDDLSRLSYYNALDDALAMFHKYLLLNYKYPNLSIWLAYASNVDYKTLAGLYGTEEWPKHVEMSFCVALFELDPFQVHMGIQRNEVFYEGRSHKALSLKLHSFAAEAMIYEYPHKRYMITAPLYQMRKILTTTLSSEDFQDGTEAQGKWVTRKDAYSYSFSIKDLDSSTVLLQTNDQGIDDGQDNSYKWLLEIRERLFTIRRDRLAQYNTDN